MDHPTGNRGYELELLVNCDQQQILTRDVDEQGFRGAPKFYPKSNKDISGPRYVMLEIDEHEGCDRALIRCSELFRAIFGRSAPLARFAFDFGADGRNDHLYRYEQTRMREDGVYNFFRTKNVLRSEEKFVAAMIYLPSTRRALTQLSQTARELVLRKKDVWPSMNAPMKGSRGWQVFGGPITGKFFDESMGQEPVEKKFFGITQLLGFDFAVDLPKFNIDYESQGLQSGKATSGGHKVPTSRTSNLPPILAAEASPGNKASHFEIDREFKEMFKGLKFGETTRNRHESEAGVRSGTRYSKDDRSVRRFSGLKGGVGDEDTGHYGMSPVSAYGTELGLQVKEDLGLVVETKERR